MKIFGLFCSVHFGLAVGMTNFILIWACGCPASPVSTIWENQRLNATYPTTGSFAHSVIAIVGNRLRWAAMRLLTAGFSVNDQPVTDDQGGTGI
jgi:hypothetical protein